MAKSTIFTDSTGKKWDFKIDVPTGSRLKNLGKDILSRNGLATLIGDPIVAIETMQQIAEPQYQAAEISQDDFVNLLTDGDQSFIDAMAALEAALEAFFRMLGQPHLADVVAKAAIAKQALREKAAANLPKLDELLEITTQTADARLDAMIAKRRKKLGELLTPCKPSSESPVSSTGPSDAS